ncbi:armadillo-type protein [Stachybotrys elegans]|uniref:Armadillo-type protein n=1 Tax=Stachybotrys elegans TaxID=80388 RepID=A0A8K0T7L8_9HYPO|nr:armadillo-type protein [Stachybotrys elegans]
MPSKSSGRIEKVRKNKNSTPHKKNHRWESFSAKLAKFNSLQPLRKVRRHDLDTEDLDASTSYFFTGLQKWSELNISKPFTSFRREVLPLCETLAQILHFEERIMDLLAQYIAEKDKESLEPLLDLLTAFSHDLGLRFEKHYGRSLQLLLDIAGKTQPVEVIEWTFGALAFLFKYLSKLLVPDLRPTYNVMAPLLGKSRHPPYIARFAAEAMSFLIKKAAAPSHRESALDLIVRHARDDLRSIAGDRQFTLYKDGLMTMFAEAIKGNDNNIHSVGPAIIETMIDAIPEEETQLSQDTIWTDVACGVLTSVVHHATIDTFDEFAEAVFVKIDERKTAIQVGQVRWQMVPYVRFLGVIGGVRKGNRITNWPRLVAQLVSLVETTSKASQESPQEVSELLWKYVMANTAIVWHHAPVDALIPHINALVQSFTREPFMRWFIPFCSYYFELDSRRFASLFRTEFQRFIASQWSQGGNEDVLCVLLPKMIESRAFPPAGDKDCCRLPQSWQDQIVSKFERLEISPFPEGGPYNKDPEIWKSKCLPKYSALLKVLELTAVHPSTNARIAELLLRKLKLALRPSVSLASDEVRFIVSQGFHAYMRMSKAAGSIDTTLGPLLRAAIPRFSQSVGFLYAYLDYERVLRESSPSGRHDGFSSDESTPEEDPVVTSLMKNLSSPSHDLRLASLELLKQVNEVPDEIQCLDSMTQVEQTPLGLEQTRAIAMHLRKLAIQYASLGETSWLKDALPRFMFGMLTVKLSPVWDEAAAALKEISQSKPGENAVATIAFEWLSVPSARWIPSAPQNHSSTTFISDFECTWKNSLERRADELLNTVEDPDDPMLQTFNDKTSRAELTYESARSRALRVLNAIPAMAEKRSRQLVPHLMSWAADNDDTGLPDDAELQTGAASWSLVDRKALLGVFSQFINPRVLYQHEQVYEVLLHLLENGDGEIQKLVLKAILAWKQEGVKPYQENLEYLLDDARFKNELTVFMQGENTIKPEHRAELMPVVLRILYGRTIAKKGASSGKQGLQATRLAVLRNLSIEDLGSFLDIATGKLRRVRVLVPPGQRKELFEDAIIAPRKQVGFLNMISALVLELGTHVTPYMETLINSVLYCLVYAYRHLRSTAPGEEDAPVEEEERASTSSVLKLTRSLGMKCLISLFQNAQDYQWEPYHEFIIQEIVTPRISNLPAETAQGVSGILQLFSTWSALPKIALFLAPHETALPEGVLPTLVGILSAEKAKDDVKVYTLGIFQNLIRLASAPAAESEFNELIKSELLDPNTDGCLTSIAAVLGTSGISLDLLDACVETILAFSSILHETANVQAILRIATFLLKQPARRVNPKTKGRILLVVEKFLALPGAKQDAGLLKEAYEALSSLFSYFKDRENRESLSRALCVISSDDEELAVVGPLCVDLNSYKEQRIDEPDYDRRLKAFTAISASREEPLTPKQWLPLLHNLIYYIRDDEEFGILSSNSADGLRRFVQNTADCSREDTKNAYEEYMTSIVMPAIYAGARELSDTVRREILRVLGFVLTVMPSWSQVADLKGLSEDRQEDSSEPLFFFNILSPASSKQTEALQMLEAANLKVEMSSQNLSMFFIPLLEHFLFNRPDGNEDHGLGALAANTISSLAMSLHWKHYRTTLQRYIGYVGSKPEQQKQAVRLLGKFVDALVASTQHRTAESMDIDEPTGSSSTRRLESTVPRDLKLNTEVVDHFLPPLTKYLHEKDESEVSYRVPVGVTIVKLLKLLSSDELDQKLAGVLTDICHILRSKSWESREMTRDTLVKIAIVLGPSFIGFILKELRSALTKGYQLHVLSYTVHSILVSAVSGFAPGELDYCLPQIVTVIMDDIFGVVGQEKDAEGYISQMKEVKSSKSQDSMELIAKNASVTHLIDLVRPLQSLLMQKVDLKMVRKIDALMSRITAGLLQNPAAESQDTLVFCYEVIQGVYKSREPQAEPKLDPRIKRYLIQKGAKKSGDRGKSTKHTYMLIRFAIDILRSMFKKHDSLRTPSSIAGFLPILGDAIVEGEDEVKISAFRLLAVIVKVPFGTDEGANIYKVAVKEATKNISMATSTTTDLSQAALKMLAVVLRDRRDVEVRPAAVDMLLEKLKDDLTEPLYRHVTFNFLRCVLERRIETATVYDTLDHVGTVMITNDDKDTRDLARGAFFQFIRDYPQKKARWTKQLNFIVANLQYDREGGRISVMEVIHLLLMKSSDEFVQEVAATCFLPLFLVLANDDSEKCRLAAAELIKEIFRKSDKERTQSFLALIRTWLAKDDNAAVQKLAFDVVGSYFEAHPDAAKNKKDFKLALEKASTVLSAEDLFVVDGDLLESTIGVVRVLTSIAPEKTMVAACQELWDHISRCIMHPKENVQLAATRIISLYLTDFAKEASKTPVDQAIEGSYGLVLDNDMTQRLVRRCLRALDGREVGEPLAAEAGQVLIFLAQRLPASPDTADESDAEEQEEEDAEEEREETDKSVEYLLKRLSYLLRKEIAPKAVAITSKTVAMEVLETICRRSPMERIRPSIKTILVPLHNLTDPSIPAPFSMDEVFKTKHEALKTRAQILMDSLQKKLGTAEYSQMLLAIREEVREKRRQRQSKRKIEAIAQPEKYGRDKRKKFEKNRERKKVRSQEQKVARQAYKGW